MREDSGSLSSNAMALQLKPDTESAAAVDDTELLRRVAGGDRAAFSQLYDRLSTVLFSTAMRILNDPKEAEDVLQDVFIQIWDKAVTYDPRLGRPFNWAVTLTRNRSIDRLRVLKRRYEFLAEATETVQTTPLYGPESGPEVYQRDQAAEVRRALEGLPLDQRQALELAFLGGMTQAEISTQLGQPLGTIKARIRRGLLKLKELLADWI